MHRVVYANEIIIKYIRIAGDTISKLSIRSNMPPCPGNMFPESFTLSVRLINDSHKSPHVANTETIMPNPIQVGRLSSGKKLSKIFRTNAAIMQNAIPPQNPSQDFFGETFSNNLCLPKRHPTQYAPVSFTQINMNVANRMCGFLKKMKLSRAIGSAMYIIPNNDVAKLWTCLSVLIYN